MNLFPGPSVGRAGDAPVVVVLGAQPWLQEVSVSADGPLPQLRIQETPQYRGTGKTEGYVDKAGKLRQRGPSCGWVGN